ncbi:hypothetical protein LG200_02200 [Methylobacillus caricis]|uniref:hypothetical protein n=1 Tax=Methylobacillus caricis TaxID=1971611 RepID=UPI001CFF56BA|nr:hypothetical protein [Methylobacillus caricis]MCB5186812.1 hypothetical protein [Methylobacillus caricis]
MPIAKSAEPETNKPTKPASPLALGWNLEVKEKSGSWRRSKSNLPTEKHARGWAESECIRWKSPLKIIEVASGKEYELYCNPKTGKLSDSNKPAPVALLTEPEASERAKKINRQCVSNYSMKSMFDCDCIENQAKAEYMRSDASVAEGEIFKKVSNPPMSNQCVNREDLYKYVYEPCAFVLKLRRPNAEEICTCTAEKTVADFAKDPVLNMSQFNRVKDAAMKQCGLGKKSG